MVSTMFCSVIIVKACLLEGINSEGSQVAELQRHDEEKHEVEMIPRPLDAALNVFLQKIQSNV